MAALDGAWGKTPGTERARLLHALADAIAANRGELAELEARNVGKAISSVKAELHQAVENFRYYGSAIAHDRRPLEPDRRLAALLLAEGAGRRRRPDRAVELPADDGDLEARARARGRLRRRPQARPADAADGASAGGARHRGRLPGRARSTSCPGDGPTTGAYLVRHPGVDKIAFTGSTRTGGEIMRLASDPVKRVTLELGGKSPNLVFADADLADAVPSSVVGDLLRRGPELRGAFAAARRAVALRRRRRAARPSWPGRSSVGDPLDAETQMGSLISAAHRERVHGFVERARDGGRRGRHGRRACPTARARSIPPTVVAATDNRAEIAQEEVFGPVVTVIPFEDEADAIRIANDVRYGLMATVWTGDPARGHRLAARIKAGTVGINMPYTAFPGIPFGGLQAVRLRARARARDARALPRDEERDRRHRLAAGEPVRAVAGRAATGGRSSPPGTAAQASYSALGIGLPVLAPTLRAEYGAHARRGRAAARRRLGRLAR